MIVTARFLLEGAWYAAEQCGLLLADAERLYMAGRFATATALALLGREELGKARILLRFARGPGILGQELPLDGLRRAIENHLTKQRNASSGVILTGKAGDGLTALVNQLADNSRSTADEWRPAWNQLQKIAKGKQNRQSDERHDIRESALYVDPDDLGQGWNRPSSLPPERARHEILDANLAYEQFLGNLYAGVPGEQLDANLVAELEHWPDRPQLPNPSYPNVPPGQGGVQFGPTERPHEA